MALGLLHDSWLQSAIQRQKLTMLHFPNKQRGRFWPWKSVFLPDFRFYGGQGYIEDVGAMMMWCCILLVTANSGRTGWRMPQNNFLMGYWQPSQHSAFALTGHWLSWAWLWLAPLLPKLVGQKMGMPKYCPCAWACSPSCLTMPRQLIELGTTGVCPNAWLDRPK